VTVASALAASCLRVKEDASDPALSTRSLLRLMGYCCCGCCRRFGCSSPPSPSRRLRWPGQGSSLQLKHKVRCHISLPSKVVPSALRASCCCCRWQRPKWWLLVGHLRQGRRHPVRRLHLSNSHLHLSMTRHSCCGSALSITLMVELWRWW
jgi:hypothetical protein